MEVPIDLPRKKATADDTTVGSVKWVCIPYFALQPYSGLLSASSVNLFPSQSLLQSQYDRTPQQRDMDQAVSQLGNVNKGECFHIAQLWCLVLENSIYNSVILRNQARLLTSHRLSCHLWQHVSVGSEWRFTSDQHRAGPHAHGGRVH